MKKNAFTAFLVYCTLLLLTVPTAAYKTNETLRCAISNIDILPQDTVYVDLLLPFDSIKECYTDFNYTSTIKSFREPDSIQLLENMSIVQYDTDNYYSYISHFKNSEISITVDEKNNVQITFGSYFQNDLYYFQKCESIKLAFIDKNGNILKISDPFSIHSRMFMSFQDIQFNEHGIKCNYSLNPYGGFTLSIVLFIGLCMLIIIILRKTRKRLRR